MKKIVKLFALCLMVVFSACALVGCGGGGGEAPKPAAKTTTHTAELFTTPHVNLQITVPEKYTIEKYKNKKDRKEGDYKFITQDGKYAILGNDKFVLEIGSAGFVFHTGRDYKKEHGNVQPDFTKYTEYMKSKAMAKINKDVKDLKIDNRPALAVQLGQIIRYSISLDGVTKSPSYAVIAVIPKKEKPTAEDIKAIAADPELKAMIESIKLEAVKK